MRTDIRTQRHDSGFAIVSVLFMMLVLSVLLMGVGTYCASHQTRVAADMDYARALDLAEAGAAYEMRQISSNAANAHTTAFTMNTPFGTSNTSFTVHAVNRGTNNGWSGPGTNLDILATGTSNGISRTIRVSSKPTGSSTNFGLFGVGTSIINGTATTVNGSVGTNAQLTFNGKPTVTGKVSFNGPGSGWQSPPQKAYDVEYNSTAVAWPTVESIASTMFPSGGLTWLALHNDNALAVPPIVGNLVLVNGNGSITFKGKAGGAHYYLTSLTMNGSASVIFDNTAGPITIWMGPSGTSGTWVFNGGTSAIPYSSAPDKAVRIYSATSNDMIFNGNTRLDAGIYNVNNAKSGRVIFNGNPTLYGNAITNMFTLNGTPNINPQTGMFTTTSGGLYGFDDSWTEVNPR
jgi:Tfp pilus assembly protein PilX